MNDLGGGAATQGYTIAILSPSTASASAGTPQTTSINTPFATAFQVHVTNGANIPVQGTQVTFTAPGSGASGSFNASNMVFTDVNGNATAPTFTANAIAGAYNVNATAPGIASPVSFNLTNLAIPVLTLTKAADASSFVPGVQIGFTITAANIGAGTATGVVLDDPLPSGPGVDWSINLVSHAASCSVQGTAPNQTLHCAAVALGSGQSESVHVVSETTVVSCQSYPNTATLTATNASSPAPATATIDCEPIRRYVKFDATGANNGTSWADAYTDLQSALGDSVNEIWVARGVYKPTAASDRSIAFNVAPHLKVYGGFAGTETLLAQRDVAANLTVLSGDIDNNDNDHGGNGIDADTSKIIGNNSYHVVVIDGTTVVGPVGDSTVLDGFTISGGKADGALSIGGGVFCNGSPGACSPRLSNLVFSGNLAVFGGGALYNGGSGGISSPTITNSTFSGNSAANGGAIYDDGSEGGTSNPSIANATFSNNSATSRGGAIYDDATDGGTSSPVIQSATFSGNSADSPSGNGSAICDFTATGINATVLTNAIVWGNTSPEISTYSVGMTLDHVVLQENACPYNVSCTTAPIGADPKLGPLQDNGGFTPTMMPGAGSSAIDTGLDSACVGAPVSALDQRGMVRPLGAHCDIGAIEATHLSLSTSDGAAFAFYGKTVQYVVTLQNQSATQTVTGVHVSGFGTAAFDVPNTLWFCTIGTCTTTQTGGPFADTATLPPNSSLTWLVNIPVFAGSNEVAATMTVRSTGAATSSDTDTLAIFRGGFE